MGTAKTWFMLFAAIACEVCGTTSLKLSQAFTVPGPSIVVVVAYIASFYLLALVLKDMSLGLAYGIWGGVGTIAVAIIGLVGWGEPFTPIMFGGIVLIVIGIVLLNLGTEELEARHEQ
jgi:multidrug transporter EmrE-like cation transporter